MRSTPKIRIFGLDFLRALAIILVVVSHTTYLLNLNPDSSIVKMVRVLGAIGVDLFFVLSGFLIGGIILKHIKSGKTSFSDLFHFWKRRWFRTLPNYFLVLFLNIIVFLLIYNRFEESLISYFFFIQNFTDAHPDFFTEAWSLSVEEYAYLFLPFLIYLSFYIFNKGKEQLFLWITLISIVILFLIKIRFFYSVQVQTYKDWSHLFRKVVLYRIDAIYIGFVIVYFIRKFPKLLNRYKMIFLLLGVFIFVLTHILILVFNLLPETHLGFYVFGYLQLVVISLGLLFPVFYQLNYKGIFSKSITFISVHSYAIYLVNYSLILLPIQKYFDVDLMNNFEKTIVLLVFLGATIIVSRLIYRYFEHPILSYRDKKYRRIN